MATKLLDLTGKTKLNPNDGRKKGFLLKTSDGKKATKGKHKGDNAVIFLAPPKILGRSYRRPKRFKLVELYEKATGKFICKFGSPARGRSQFYEEDGNSRGIYQGPYAAADLPSTPCTLVADHVYWELKNVRERID